MFCSFSALTGNGSKTSRSDKSPHDGLFDVVFVFVDDPSLSRLRLADGPKPTPPSIGSMLFIEDVFILLLAFVVDADSDMAAVELPRV